MRRSQRNSAANTFRNLIYNPQFAGITSNTTIRTNLAPNPNAVTATGWFTASGVASTAATNQSGGPGGRTYARITATGTATGTGYFAYAYGQLGGGANAAQITAGTTYTLSLYVRATMVNFSQPKVRLRWKDAAGATLGSDIVVVASGATSGNFIRLNASGVAPASASYIEALGGFDNSLSLSTITVGDTVDVSSVLVEASVSLDTYFDGASSASGDFTFTWNGSANASTSRQQALWANNLALLRNNANPDAKFFAYQSVAEDGHVTTKWLAPKNTGTSSWRVGGLATAGFDYAKIKSGQKYTLMFRHRSSGWGAGQNVNVTMQDGSGLNPIYTQDVVTLNVGWSEYRKVFTSALNGYSGLQIYFSLPSIPQVATDGIFEVRDWMIVEGDYQGGFFDGSKTFAKWEGTANGSTSLGYPPQLRDIAGTPFYDGSSIAQLTDIVMPNGPITVYSVQSMNSNANNPGYWEITTGQGSSFGTTGVCRWIVNGTALRFDNMTTGNSILTQAVPGTATVSQVLVASVDPASLGVETQVNNGATVLVSPNGSYRTVTSGYYMRVGARDNVTAGVAVTTTRLMIYLGKHDIDTRLAISRYLGSQHGVTVS